MRKYKGYMGDDGVIYPSAGEALNADLARSVNELLDANEVKLTPSQKAGVRDLIAYGETRRKLDKILEVHSLGLDAFDWPVNVDVEIIA